MKSPKELKIIAIDPGETTGIAVLEGSWTGSVQAFVERNLVATMHLESKSQLLEYENASNMRDLIQAMMPKNSHGSRIGTGNWVQDAFVVVVEDFVLYGGTHSSDPSGLSPVRIAAMLNALLYESNIRSHVEMSYQMASQIKAGASRSAVSSMRGLKTEVEVLLPHGRDALAHAYAWLKAHETALDHSFLA